MSCDGNSSEEDDLSSMEVGSGEEEDEEFEALQRMTPGQAEDVLGREWGTATAIWFTATFRLAPKPEAGLGAGSDDPAWRKAFRRWMKSTKEVWDVGVKLAEGVQEEERAREYDDEDIDDSEDLDRPRMRINSDGEEVEETPSEAEARELAEEGFEVTAEDIAFDEATKKEAEYESDVEDASEAEAGARAHAAEVEIGDAADADNDDDDDPVEGGGRFVSFLSEQVNAVSDRLQVALGGNVWVLGGFRGNEVCQSLPAGVSRKILQSIE